MEGGPLVKNGFLKLLALGILKEIGQISAEVCHVLPCLLNTRGINLSDIPFLIYVVLNL